MARKIYIGTNSSTLYTWKKYNAIEEIEYRWKKYKNYKMSKDGTNSMYCEADVGQLYYGPTIGAGNTPKLKLIGQGNAQFDISNMMDGTTEWGALESLAQELAANQYDIVLVESNELSYYLVSYDGTYNASGSGIGFDGAASYTLQRNVKGDFIENIYSSSERFYPDNGSNGSFWFVRDGEETRYSQGSYVNDVTASSASAYPDNGRHTDGYWYVKQPGVVTVPQSSNVKKMYIGTVGNLTTYEKHKLISPVDSYKWDRCQSYVLRERSVNYVRIVENTSSQHVRPTIMNSASPKPAVTVSNGKYKFDTTDMTGHSVWWEDWETVANTYKGYDLCVDKEVYLVNLSGKTVAYGHSIEVYGSKSYAITPNVKGDFIDSVVSAGRNDYPDDGQKGDYFYLYVGPVKSDAAMGELVSTIQAPLGIYPDNGPHTDGYWYVKKSASSSTSENISRNIKHGYIGVNNIAKRFFGTPSFKWKKYKAVYNSPKYFWNKYNSVHHPAVTTYTWDRYNLDGTAYALKFAAGYSHNVRSRDIDSDYCYGKVEVNSSGRVYYSQPTLITESNYNSLESRLVDADIGPTSQSGWSTVVYGSFIDDVHLKKCTSDYPENIPTGGTKIVAKYTGLGVKTEQVTGGKGSSAGQVTSPNRSTYPTDGEQGSYWYTYRGSSTTPESYTQGTYITRVGSTNKGAYPNNGRHSADGYWYVYQSSQDGYYSRGDFIEDVISENATAFPENGRHSDGYWYVKQ